MKVAFIHLNPSANSKNLLQRFHCTISGSAEADILCKKVTELNTLFQEPLGAITILFATSDNIGNRDFQEAIASLPHPPFVCPLEKWEHHLACILPSVLSLATLTQQSQQQGEEVARLSQHTENLIQQFQSDLELATKVHHQLLPPSEIQIPGISVISKYLPASGLGGDYFDVFELPDKRHLGILIADSQTHGMASALLSTLLKLRLDELKASGSLSQHLMNFLNQELFSIHKSQLPGLDLVFGLLDRSTLTFEYCVAGNLRPLFWNYPHFTELPCSETPPLGVLPDHKYSTSLIQLRPGDLLFLHTNGLEAIFGKTGEPLRGDLASVFKSIKKLEPLDFQTEILAHINEYQETHTEIPDDITLIQLFIDKKALYVAQSK